MNNIDFTQASWINPPAKSLVQTDAVSLTTDPGTDFWQRSYYGFRNDNDPALLLDLQGNVSFTIKTEFDYQKQFDQCGLILYQDQDNWCKASVEFETVNLSRLGSVVTNNGYSDWATTDIESINSIWYRLSRRGPDFLIEYSLDGDHFRQMRIFHMHSLGETTALMGQSNPPLPDERVLQVGVYACSPNDSSFEARFLSASIGPSLWKAHVA